MTVLFVAINKTYPHWLTSMWGRSSSDSVVHSPCAPMCVTCVLVRIIAGCAWVFFLWDSGFPPTLQSLPSKSLWRRSKLGAELRNAGVDHINQSTLLSLTSQGARDISKVGGRTDYYIKSLAMFGAQKDSIQCFIGKKAYLPLPKHI